MPRQPNLLFLFADQQRYDTMACYGNDWMQAPTFNALAAESVVFERAYVTQPVCTPARASIMTGLYPHTCGMTSLNLTLPAEVPTVAELLPHDYACGYVGKWHLGNEIFPQHGFEHWVSIEDNYFRYFTDPSRAGERSDYHHYLLAQGYRPDRETRTGPMFSRRFCAGLPEEHTKAAFTGRAAAEFVRGHADTPFALYVNFFEPHTPYLSPLADLYPPQDLPAGPTFYQPPGEDAAHLNRLLAQWRTSGQMEGYDLSREAGMRELASHYWGNVSLVDRATRTVLDALDEMGLANDTLVVYTSEHGDMAGDHALVTKTVMYEESARVPLLLRVPWLGREQRRIAGQVSQVDLTPTLLDLLGVQPPAGLDGESRAAVVRDGGDLTANPVVVEWHGRDGRPPQPLPDAYLDAAAQERVYSAPRRTIICDGYKLNLCGADIGELYDLVRDPHETRNVYQAADYAGVVADLTARLRAWQVAQRDPVDLESGAITP